MEGRGWQGAPAAWRGGARKNGAEREGGDVQSWLLSENVSRRVQVTPVAKEGRGEREEQANACAPARWKREHPYLTDDLADCAHDHERADDEVGYPTAY